MSEFPGRGCPGRTPRFPNCKTHSEKDLAAMADRQKNASQERNKMDVSSGESSGTSDR